MAIDFRADIERNHEQVGYRDGRGWLGVQTTPAETSSDLLCARIGLHTERTNQVEPARRILSARMIPPANVFRLRSRGIRYDTGWCPGRLELGEQQS